MPPRKNRRNLYRILHVQPDAPTAVIRASYRTIMQKLRRHPDLGGDEWDAAIINEAYAVLTDERRRAEYDARQFSERKRSNVAGGPGRTADEPPTPSRSPPPEGDRPHDGADPPPPCPFCRQAAPPLRDGTCPRCSAPLDRVATPTSPIDRRRRIERLSIDDSTVIFDHWQRKTGLRVRLVDFSPCGCRLLSARSFRTGQRLRIADRRFSAIGEVRDCRPEATGSGHSLAVEFLTLRYDRPSGGFVSVEA